ncbi:hypothetical protein F5Y19DRAFT_472693 [Xylariaceae sp. FL1651]|nr:hypothetical protein F5Y19DRAFT_472693 [Xylariaceae sp. FL1651]
MAVPIRNKNRMTPVVQAIIGLGTFAAPALFCRWTLDFQEALKNPQGVSSKYVVILWAAIRRAFPKRAPDQQLPPFSRGPPMFPNSRALETYDRFAFLPRVIILA